MQMYARAAFERARQALPAHIRACAATCSRGYARIRVVNISRKVVRPEPNGRNNFNC